MYGNALTAIFGFFLAAKGSFNPILFLAMLVGLSLVIASACVFNNYIDREVDTVMERTKKRALATGDISGKNALIYGAFLGVIGFLFLLVFTNVLTTLVSALGFFFYVVLYSYFKRHSVYGTEVGSISGAIPPVVGYCALTNRLDLGAVLLFLIMVFWQMPHFYGIAIYRLRDYASTKLPILPVKKGIYTTKLHMLFYLLAFLISAPLLTLFGYTGKVYFGVVTLLGLIWLFLGIQGFWTKSEAKWARKIFFFSLVIILALCIVVPLDKLIPI